MQKYEDAISEDRIPYLDAEDYVDIADYYLNANRIADAFKCIKTGEQIHNDNELILSQKAGMLIFKKRYEEAITILDKLDQKATDVMYMRCQLKYGFEGDKKEAEKMFHRWIKEVEKEEKKFFDSRGEDEEDDIDPEEESLDNSIRDAYIHVISTLFELSPTEFPDKQLITRWVNEYMTRYEPIGDNYFDLLLGDIVRENNAFELIDNVYSAILEINPYANEGWLVLANAQFNMHKFAETVESCDFALAINPQCLDAYKMKGTAMYYLERFEEGVEIFKHIGKTNPEDNTYYLQYAYCLAHLKQFDEAIEKARISIDYYDQIESEDKEGFAEAMYEICELAMYCENFDFALEMADRALKHMPNDSDLLILKGMTLVLMGDDANGKTFIGRGLLRSNDLIECANRVGKGLVDIGRGDIALELINTFKTAIDEIKRLDKDDPTTDTYGKS